jgi:carbon monoxide dehydrogenase subunit G
MAKIIKEILVKAPLDDTWKLVSDMERFSLCIPGCKEVKKVSETTFDWIMEAKVMRTTRKVKARTEATLMEAPTRAEFVGEGRLFERSNHYRLTISGATDLERISDQETKIKFSGDVSASGIGGALIEKVAAGQMDQLFDQFENNLKQALGDTGV